MIPITPVTIGVAVVLLVAMAFIFVINIRKELK
jgi:hypothetical protein